MPREKEGYREMLAMLSKDYPMLMMKKQACQVLGVTLPYLNKLIARGKISCDGKRIPIGSLAKYLCG